MSGVSELPLLLFRQRLILAVLAGSVSLRDAVLGVVFFLLVLMIPRNAGWRRTAILMFFFLVGFGVTDEIFGVSVAVPGYLNPRYSYGLMAVAIPGWALGTCLGVVMGNVLPASVVSALSVGLYGMFIAVIVPPARKNRVLAGLIVISMAASLLFAKVPPMSGLSTGMRVIILTVVFSAAAAILFPVKEEDDAA